MKCYHYKDNNLFIENIELSKIPVNFATPCYVYSKDYITKQINQYHHAFQDIPYQIHYALKANSNISILELIGNSNCGFDVVSLGEMQKIIKAHHNLEKTVFSGVGKTHKEIEFALKNNIQCFNVESESELYRINEIATNLNKTAAISFRVNPNINANTHPYIATGLKTSKFGLDFDDVIKLCKLTTSSLKNIKIVGLSFHLGSQILELSPFVSALQELLSLKQKLNILGINIENINVGGGLGVCYQNEKPPSIQEYAAALINVIKDHNVTLHLEPGRSIMANAGILLTKVEYIKTTKEKNFAIVDAGINDLLRPALYNAKHNIIPVKINNSSTTPNNKTTNLSNMEQRHYDVVGPVCESSDVFQTNLPLNIKEGDLLAITSVGAYGFSMASTYNSRPLLKEIMIDNSKFTEIN